MAFSTCIGKAWKRLRARRDDQIRGFFPPAFLPAFLSANPFDACYIRHSFFTFNAQNIRIFVFFAFFARSP